MTKSRGIKLKKGDLVIFALCAVLGLLPLGLLVPKSGAGSYAVVRIDGKRVASLPLSVNGTYEYTENGKNIVVVEAGRVCVAEADCPDETCVGMGWIGSTGETLVCLPHRLTVTITGGEAAADAVTR